MFQVTATHRHYIENRLFNNNLEHVDHVARMSISGYRG